MAGPTDERPSDASYIEGYGPDGFRVAGVLHAGPLLVAPGLVTPWPVAGLGEADEETIAPLLAGDPGPEVLILGCGPRLAPPPAALRTALRGRGIGLEPMDTGAACRTYNLLLIEGRPVAAALLPVGGDGGGG